MTNSGARRTTIQTVWQIFVGSLLGLFVVQLVGIFLVRFAQIARGQMNFVHLLEFSVRQRLFLISLPALVAAMLVRKRPMVALGMLLSAAMVWLISGV
jgi:ABC-type phosphate transport system permease subunit